MRAYSASYEQPPAPYQPGQVVKFNGKTYQVTSCTHTHAQLEGLQHAVVVWQLQRVTRKKNLLHP